MRLATRPSRHQSYSEFIEQWTTALGSETEITSASALTATPHPFGTGVLAREHHESYRSARYAVYSYATPIAWLDESGDWYMPMDKYSQTTTGHQSHIRSILRNHLGVTVHNI